MAFRMTLLTYNAVMVLAAGGTESAAAAAAMVTERTIQNWKQQPEFEKCLKDVEEDILGMIRSNGVQLAVKDREARLLRRNERANLLADRIERAKAGDVGDLVRLLKEERDNERQAAIEVGDWTEKREVDLTKVPAEKLVEVLNAEAES